MYKIKHIGLQIKEKDLKHFYQDVLGFQQERNFTLSKEETYNIFQIDTEITILFGNCHGCELELFVYEQSVHDGFSHVCISVDDAEAMAARAIKNDYSVYIRKKNEFSTYFIQDSNHHIFEVKNN
ncbi:MAG: VOC family protein [Bacteroidales bacterium]|nr:VOC family protein [Bacteroidales bacterium]